MNLLSKNADLEWIFIVASHVRVPEYTREIKNQAISQPQNSLNWACK